MGLYDFFLGGKRKLKITELLLKRNGRFSFVDSKADLVRTPEYVILTAFHYIRHYQSRGNSLAQSIYHTENQFFWIKKSKSNINELKKFHDIVHFAANGSISDAVQAVHDYLIFKVRLEHPGNPITDDQIIDNLNYIESNYNYGDY